MANTLTAAKRRVLDLLKRIGPAPAVELARRLDLTDVAVRQHLAALEQRGLVEQAPTPPAGRGRPSSAWSLTEPAAALFPDRHGDLTVSLIQATRRALGKDGLDRVVAQRAAEQLRDYRATLPPTTASLKKRVEALARRRTAEGYMADVRRTPPGEAGDAGGTGTGGFLLTEHHCPICDAARCCQGLCAAELDVFRKYFGRGVKVDRVEHLLSDGNRCIYRVEPLSARSKAHTSP